MTDTETLDRLAARQRTRAMDIFLPSPKQFEFFLMSSTASEIMLRAGNQQGKSHAGSFAVACHLTGDYPKWWPGRRFTHPITAWVAGVKGTDVRDIMQDKLCGTPGVPDAFGTGMIPREAFEGVPSMARGVTDLYDTVHVKHLAPGGGGTIDGISALRFKTYPEGRRGFQGKAVDLIQLDEEPGHGPGEDGIYSECQARTLATSGLILVTLTPLLGRTTLVNYFETPAGHVALVKMGLNDARHLTQEQKDAAIAKYATAHDRDARLNGDPLMGSGRIFEMDEANLRWTGDPRGEWAYLWGLDFGINHPFGAALTGWDRDADCFYVLGTVRMTGGTPLQHIPQIRALGANVPVAWPPDGHTRDKGSGEALAKQYRNPGPGMPGLNMLSTHATFADGSISTEAGVVEMLERMQTGRFKVAAHLDDWFGEYRNYHRKDGLIVKVGDDLLSATRIALMMKRFARTVTLGSSTRAISQARRMAPRSAGPVDPWSGRPA